MINFILKVATGARALIALAALGVGGTLLFRLSPYETLKGLVDGAALPEETITSPTQLAATLEALGAAGREMYLRFQLWDVINPVLIGAAGAMLLGWLLTRAQRGSSAWRFVLVLPIVMVVADMLENVFISAAIGAYPETSALGAALPLATAAKFGAAITMMAAAILLSLIWVRACVGRRRASGE